MKGPKLRWQYSTVGMSIKVGRTDKSNNLITTFAPKISNSRTARFLEDSSELFIGMLDDDSERGAQVATKNGAAFNNIAETMRANAVQRQEFMFEAMR
jgi:hypothetical protein